MTGTIDNRRFKNGLTLIEAMIAILIIAIVSMGALSYQYHGARHFRQARAELTATYIGQFLLEDWKSSGGTDTYDPTSLGFGFGTITGSGGNYAITVDGMTFSILLPPPSVVRTDPQGFAGTLRQIAVTIRWRNDFASGAPGAGDPMLVFTTYVRNQD